MLIAWPARSSKHVIQYPLCGSLLLRLMEPEDKCQVYMQCWLIGLMAALYMLRQKLVEQVTRFCPRLICANGEATSVSIPIWNIGVYLKNGKKRTWNAISRIIGDPVCLFILGSWSSGFYHCD